MDMKHDFTPDPEVHAAAPRRPGPPVELLLIVAIFALVWAGFAIQLLVDGFRW